MMARDHPIQVNSRSVADETSLTFCHVPGPPAFLVNVEKLGVAWDEASWSPLVTFTAATVPINY